MRKKVFNILIRFIVSILLLILVLRKIDIPRFTEIMKSMNFLFLVPIGIIIGGSFFFGALKMEKFLFYKNVKIPLKKLIRIDFFVNAVDTLTPTFGFGGEVTKIQYLTSYTKDRSVAVASVLINELTGFVGLLAVCLPAAILGLYLNHIHWQIALAVIIIFLFYIFFLFCISSKKIMNKFQFFFKLPILGKTKIMAKKTYGLLHKFKGQHNLSIKLALFSILIHTINIMLNYFIALSIGVKIPIIFFFIFIPISLIITMLPISIGGLGVRENVYAFFFVKAGLSVTQCVSISLIYFGIWAFLGTIAGIMWVCGYEVYRPEQV